jgi:cysteinyl-tRNA synthetase
VNFAVRKFDGYGKLSGKSLDDLRAGERVAVGDDKRDPLDFVLWKSAKPDEPDDAKYGSAYGPGRPGWHIECSAMSCALLGERFDIHGGGMDLQFPHHENEIAQSEGAFGHQHVNVWLHNGFLNVDNEKMSKSLGNFFTIRDVLKKFDGETLRFFMLRTHYRSPFNFSDQGLDDARTALRRLYTALDGVICRPTTRHRLGPAAGCRLQGGDGRRLQHPRRAGGAVRPGQRPEPQPRPGHRRAAAALAGTLGVLQQAPRAFLQAALGGGGLDEATITGPDRRPCGGQGGEELCRSRPHPPGTGGPGRGTEGFRHRHHLGAGLMHAQATRPGPGGRCRRRAGARHACA